jgi:uncharacterized protein (TIGR02231 family)
MPPCTGRLREIPVDTLDAAITDVVVYRDGARVTRTGQVQLAKGPQKVIIEGITERAREDSFRVSGRGPAALSAIDVKRISHIFEPKEDTKDLFAQLKKLRTEADGVADEIETQKARLAHVGTLQARFSETFGMVYAADEGSIESLVEIDKTSTEMGEEIRARLRELDEKAQELKKKIAAVQANINRIDAERRTEDSFSVEISLEASRATKVELLVTYQATGSGWQPTYDVDLHPGKAILRRIAQVSNRTREDWRDVNLTVSTATAKPAEAIEARPYYISAYDAQAELEKREKRRAEGMGRMALAESAAPPPAPMMEIEEEYAEASETVSGIAVYEIPKAVTLLADSEMHPITLTEEELASEAVHHWYPDGMAEVVAQDVVTNGSNVILPGPVKVYAEGDYIGESTLGLVSPREEFKLGARIANDVKGEKKMVEREVEKAGLTRGKLRRSYKYRLEVTNYAKRKISIEIFDRVPHSLSTDIEVKADFEKLGAKSNDLGILEWYHTIEPNEKRAIEYEYEVQWERGITVSPSLP